VLPISHIVKKYSQSLCHTAHSDNPKACQNGAASESESDADSCSTRTKSAEHQVQVCGERAGEDSDVVIVTHNHHDMMASVPGRHGDHITIVKESVELKSIASTVTVTSASASASAPPGPGPECDPASAESHAVSSSTRSSSQTSPACLWRHWCCAPDWNRHERTIGNNVLRVLQVIQSISLALFFSWTIASERNSCLHGNYQNYLQCIRDAEDRSWGVFFKSNSYTQDLERCQILGGIALFAPLLVIILFRIMYHGFDNTYFTNMYKYSESQNHHESQAQGLQEVDRSECRNHRMRWNFHVSLLVLQDFTGMLASLQFLAISTSDLQSEFLSDRNTIVEVFALVMCVVMAISRVLYLTKRPATPAANYEVASSRICVGSCSKVVLVLGGLGTLIWFYHLSFRLEHRFCFMVSSHCSKSPVTMSGSAFRELVQGTI
jgi:hypothetical protein